MKSLFTDFKNKRDTRKFSESFNNLCESIAQSGMDFDTYWEQHGLPALMVSPTCQTTDELLVEFNPFSSLKSMFGKAPQPTPQQPNPAPTPIAAPQPVEPAQEDPRVAKARQGLEGSVNNIKKRFMVAMKDFHNAVTTDAKKSGNPQEWKLANVFYKQMMGVMQPKADQFLQNLKINIMKQGETSPQDAEFGKQTGQMQANKMASMKSKLQDPATQARLDTQRSSQGGWSKPDLMQWAKETAAAQGSQPSMYVNPDGTPTQAAMAILPSRAEWQSKQKPMMTAGAQQAPAQQPAMTNMENADPFLQSLRKGAGRGVKEANLMR